MSIGKLFSRLFHIHEFGLWYDEPTSRTQSLWTPIYGQTHNSVWYQRRECECGAAQLRKLEKPK